MNVPAVGRIVMAKTENGTHHAVGLVAAHVGEPSYTLQLPDGEEISWLARLCRRADVFEECIYWRERAFAAEARLTAIPAEEPAP